MHVCSKHPNADFECVGFAQYLRCEAVALLCWCVFLAFHVVHGLLIITEEMLPKHCRTSESSSAVDCLHDQCGSISKSEVLERR